MPMDSGTAPGTPADLGPALVHAAELEALLAIPLDAAASLADRSEWLEPVVTWLSRPGMLPLPEGVPSPGGPAAVRLWVLHRVIRRRPPLAKKLGRVLQSMLRETSAVHLFTATGLGAKHSFLVEAASRLSRKLLPFVPTGRRLDEVVEQLFPRHRDAAWIGSLSAPLVSAVFQDLLVAAEEEGDPWESLRSDVADSVTLLATWVSGLGLQEDVRVRAGEGPVGLSPFSRLPRSCRAMAEFARRSTFEPGEAASAMEDCREDVAACRRVMERVTEHLEQYGVSVDLVFRLDLMGRQLDRVEELLAVLVPRAATTPTAAGVRLFAHLVDSSAGDRSVVDLARANLRLLSLKVIESAGSTGEHYIAAGRREYRVLFLSACGGGLFTAATTLVKYAGAALALAPFFDGLYASLNYAVSFLLLQAFHFTLSSKQPAATAATLAQAVGRLQTEADLDRLVTLIARTVRSQLAAAVGNIVLVVPTALALDVLYQQASGHSFFDAEKAAYVIHSLHPLESGTLFFAALTGALLWLSSLAGGWLENWASFMRLPEACLHSRRLRRWLGASGSERFAHELRKNVAGIGGNVTIGFLLGMTPAFARFFGLPLDIRHVTLSAGALTFAVHALGTAGAAGVLWAAAGVALVGVLNFGVSFALALDVASRACGVSREDQKRVGRALLRSLVRSPGRFFFPPRESFLETG